MLGSETVTSLKRGLGLWCTRTMSADEQSEEVDFRLFLLGVRVIQHICALGGWAGGAVGGGEGVEPQGQRSKSGWWSSAVVAGE